MIGQGLALGLGLGRNRPLDFHLLCCRRDLLAFQQQFQLIEALGPGAEAMAAQAGQLVLQLLDQEVPRPDFGLVGHHHGLQLGGVIGQVLGVVQHRHLIADRPRKGNPNNGL